MSRLLSKEGVLALVVAALVLWFVAVRTDAPEARALGVAVGDAHQLVVVRSGDRDGAGATLEALAFDGTRWVRQLGPFRAHLGRNGWNPDHVEGDGTTPTGIYGLTEAFGLQPNPGTALPWRRVASQDWWVSDPASPLYNTYQPGPPDGRWDPARGELLSGPQYRDAYRYAAVVDFNRSPVEAGRGSAIFVHVGSSPTSGCVAVAEDDLVALLRWLDPAQRPRIVLGWDELISNVTTPAEVPIAAESGGIEPVAPRRILDTRIGLGATGALGAGEELELGLGADQGVPADAVAVAVNLTVDGATAPTFLTAYPAGGARPGTSNVNARPGEARAALAVVRLGTARRIRIRNDAGRAHAIADLVGYVSPRSPNGFVPVTPARLIDTRQTGTPLGPGGAIDVAAQAPPGAVAAVVNLTATAATRPTWIAAFASDRPYGGTSNLNALAGLDTANLALVPLSADGRFRLLNDAGTVHVVADVAGYVVAGSGTRYTAAQLPVRVVDSRDGRGLVGPLRAGHPATVHLDGLPEDARAVALTVTGTDASASTWLKVAPPAGATIVSSLNLQAGAVPRANLAVVPVVAGTVEITLGDANAQVVLDVAGWFSPPPPSPPSSATVTTVR